MLATVHCGSLVGVEALPVDVEVHLGQGLPGFELVGLAEAAVRESRVRVRAAIANAGFALPARHVVLNLAPGDLRKTGAQFDLPIAIALLAAAGGCAPNELDHTLILGELSLGGDVRPVRGVLAHLRGAVQRGLTRAIVPAANAAEASLACGIDVRVATTLAECVQFLDATGTLPRAQAGEPPTAPLPQDDLADVRGQEGAKRALEIAAAGGHHALLIGPPGAGKTMLARRVPTLLPPPTDDEALEIATIRGAAGLTAGASRPFRAPHHTASEAALIGGGDPVRPGEVTLAHGGVLFLDELPEFSRRTIESLRTTMEDGVAVVARVRSRVTMPAKPLVIAAMNPCPCGYSGDATHVCSCSPDRILQYQARVSGPLLDRFDLHVTVPPMRTRSLRDARTGDSSAVIRARVMEARARARHRRAHKGDRALGSTAKPDALQLLDEASEKLGLSARGYVKVLRVARTLADLDARVEIDCEHVAEAVQYRRLDRHAPVRAA